MSRNSQHYKQLTLYLLSVGFFAAGLMHFIYDSELARITPLPYALELVWLTGLMEFGFALYLLQNKQHPLTGLLIACFLLAVLPANIYMALERIPMFGKTLPDWAAWLRVAMQLPLIALVLWATHRPAVVQRMQ